MYSIFSYNFQCRGTLKRICNEKIRFKKVFLFNRITKKKVCELFTLYKIFKFKLYFHIKIETYTFYPSILICF